MHASEMTVEIEQAVAHKDEVATKDHEVLRELNALELCLVGGGSVAIAFI
jgi:hypothetical protein